MVDFLKQWLSSDIVICCITAFSTILVACITYYKSKKLKFFDAFYEQKISAYNEFFDALGYTFLCSSSEECEAKTMSATYKIALLSSEKAYGQAILLSSKLQRPNNPNDPAIAQATVDAMKAFREDLDECKNFKFR